MIELQEPQTTAQIERRDVDQIIEEPDGKVTLKFRSLSLRDNSSFPEPSTYRRSFSDTSSQTGNLDPSQRYRFRSPFPEPIVDPPSPSSSGIGNTINMLTRLDFTIDWPLLKEDYYSQQNSALRKWFEVINFDLREQIKKEWIADMERLHVSIPFFKWFPTFTSRFGLPDCYSKPSINVQTTLFQVWHFTKGGSVSSIHPPVEDLKLQRDGVSYVATPFRKGREGDGTATYSDVQKIHQQLNYTNTAMSTIATQLNQVATRLDTPSPTPSSSKSKETYANSISKPFFKIDNVPRKAQDDFTTAFSNASLINQISQQIKALELSKPSTSCIDKTCSKFQQDTSSETDDEEDVSTDSDKEATIQTITKTFEDNQEFEVNKINYGNKSEDLNLCNELKLQAKYGDKSNTRSEMGNFCEAFGIEKIEAPSTQKKRIIKGKNLPQRPFRPKPTAKPSLPVAKPKHKPQSSKKQTKKPIVCFKCGKPGHKSFQCKICLLYTSPSPRD